ncbi:MAG: hypothetical protein JWQ72_1453 [Polaromonas sp.]|nr:hypothetical protein [Polaromonas sp.]
MAFGQPADIALFATASRESHKAAVGVGLGHKLKLAMQMTACYENNSWLRP